MARKHTVCRSITIPRELQETLSTVRRDINVSGVCTTALQEAVGAEPDYLDKRGAELERKVEEIKELKKKLHQVMGQRDAALQQLSYLRKEKAA